MIIKTVKMTAFTQKYYVVQATKKSIWCWLMINNIAAFVTWNIISSFYCQFLGTKLSQYLKKTTQFFFCFNYVVFVKKSTININTNYRHKRGITTITPPISINVTTNKSQIDICITVELTQLVPFCFKPTQNSSILKLDSVPNQKFHTNFFVQLGLLDNQVFLKKIY
eukprot:TRINITY_DN15164_c0_g1_i4.p1 TRINITY_DN15164_c0_g1~~TRINITY_DN15164_c0_g1_i4.p1  ORF type:complete len:167 (+),score=0.53 TRINITY_DN15164_c0_g1_i4:664-1164(+)